MSGAQELVARYGSPLYVYELDELEAAYTRLRKGLPSPSTLYYSLKANPHPVLARVLRLNGCRAEISSCGELAAALDAGFTGAACMYTGPGKTWQEISTSIGAGVRRFSVESEADYGRVAAAARHHGATVDCLIRVNTNRSHGAAGVRMTGAPSQFGVDAGVLHAHPELYRPRRGARIVGAHFFPLSNARDIDTLAAELLASITEAGRLRSEAGFPMQVVDLGGGFAAPYAKTGDQPDYRDLGHLIEPALDVALPGWRSGETEIAFESGRYLVGQCGRLICTVQDVKKSGDSTFIVLDSGINNLGGMAGLRRLPPVAATVLPVAETMAGRRPDRPDPGRRVTLVGPLCTPVDLLARETTLADVAIGDLVEIPNTGAYGLTASLLGFLSRPPAAEVILRGGAPVHASRLELRREPVECDRSSRPATKEAVHESE